MEKHMRSIILAALALGGTLGGTLGAREARAQSAPDRSTRAATSAGRVLAPVTVTARRGAPTLAEEGVLGRILRVDREHAQVVNLQAGNRALAAHVRWQGKEIERLETRLDYLKTTVTDSIVHEIAEADSATLAVRAQRLALEARLEAMEARIAARNAANAAAGAASAGASASAASPAAGASGGRR
jgi:hypothetical protein